MSEQGCTDRRMTVVAADKSIRVMYGSPETEIRESPESDLCKSEQQVLIEKWKRRIISDTSCQNGEQ